MQNVRISIIYETDTKFVGAEWQLKSKSPIEIIRQLNQIAEMEKEENYRTIKIKKK